MPTIPQIKESLDELGVPYKPRAKKAELERLLRRAQGEPDSPPEPAGPPPRRAITRAHAEVIAQRATSAARGKVAELPEEDRGAVTGALDTLEQSAEQALVEGALVEDVQSDLSAAAELTVQSIDEALGLSDEEERQDALDETVSALEAGATNLELSAIQLPTGTDSDDEETFASAASALQFEQAWSDDSGDEAAAPRTPPAVPARPSPASASQAWFGSDEGSSSDSDGELGGTDSDDEDEGSEDEDTDSDSLTGGGATNGNGGALANLTGWTSAPILGYRILQDPGAYADTLTLRFDLKTALNGVAAQTAHPTDAELKAGAADHYPYQEMPELVVAVIHQKVFEAFWNDSETFPSHVIVDDVLN